MSGASSIDLFLGLLTVLGLLSVLCLVIEGALAVYLRRFLPRVVAYRRAQGVEWVLRHVLGPIHEPFAHDPRVEPTGSAEGRHFPTRLPPRLFAEVALDYAEHYERSSPGDAVNELPPGLLRDAVLDSHSDRERGLQSLETFYAGLANVARDREIVARRLRLFLVALVICAAANIDAVAIGERLWKGDTISAVVAEQSAQTPGRGAPSAVANAAREADELEEMGIPIGWPGNGVNAPYDGVLDKVFSLLITVIVGAFGAEILRLAMSRLSGRPAAELPRSAVAPVSTLPSGEPAALPAVRQYTPK